MHFIGKHSVVFMTKDWLVSALQFWNLIWWLHLTRKLNPWMKITGSLMVLAPVFTFYQDQVSSSTCNCYLLLFGFVEFIFSFVSAHGIKFLSGRLFFFIYYILLNSTSNWPIKKRMKRKNILSPTCMRAFQNMDQNIFTDTDY